MLSLLGGVVAIVIGILWMVPNFLGYAWDDFMVVAKGSIAALLIVGGAVAVAGGFSSIKDKLAEKKEKKEEPKAEEKKEN